MHGGRGSNEDWGTICAGLYLVDGHHRIAATRQMLGIEDIAVEIVDGTFADALWLSWGANRGHGLRRTQKDKRRAIQAAIDYPRWSLESDRSIARHIGVITKQSPRCRVDRKHETLVLAARLLS